MVSKIIFVNSLDDVNYIHNEKKQFSDYKIFSFDIFTHNELKKYNIKHEIGESILNESDKIRIFDSAVSLWDWYNSNNKFKKMEFNGINLLELLDYGEFHNLIVQEIFVSLAIKRIIEVEKPSTIVTTEHFSKMINEENKKGITLKVLPNSKHEFTVTWDKILLRFSIGKFPVRIPISRGTYQKIKSINEYLIGRLFNLWLKFNELKKCILFLEFNPLQYEELVKELSKFEQQVIFVNRRRPAAYNLKSAKLLNKFKCKIITPEKFLTSDEKENIKKSTIEYRKKIVDLWDDNEYLENYFMIEDCKIWPLVKEILFEIYDKRIHEYLSLLVFAEKLFTKLKISNIVSLNVIGETEKAIIKSNKNNLPTIMLEHAFANYLPEITRYVIFDIAKLNDRIAVWGESQKKYLVEHLKISNEKIILSGSPKHDSFFKINNYKKKKRKKIVVTTQNLEWTNAQVDTNTYIKLERILKDIIDEISKKSSFDFVIKLHPSQDKGNEYLKKRIHEINPDILIQQIESIQEVIGSSDYVININSELIPSSAMFDAIILEKPVMNIIMTQNKLDFEFMKYETVFTVDYKDGIKTKLNEFIDNEELRNNLIKNSKKYIMDYLSNPGSSSKYFASYLNSS